MMVAWIALDDADVTVLMFSVVAVQRTIGWVIRELRASLDHLWKKNNTISKALRIAQNFVRNNIKLRETL